MNKRIVFITFTISLLILIGCDRQSNITISKTTPFVGGSKSLELKFVAGEPPEEALDQDQLPFVVSVSVENLGEFDVLKEDVTIELRGFRPADFNNPVVLKNPEEDLDKTFIDTDGNEIPGTFAHVTFDGFSYTDTLQANNEFPILADVCYKYGTEAQLDLCYLEDLTDIDENEVCEVRGSKSVASSASPVSVESLKEDLGGTEKISFTFEVVHRGPGLLSRLGTDCNDVDVHQNKNRVFVEVDTDLPGLSCTGLANGTATSGFATLNSGKRNIRCTQDNPGDGDYIKKAFVTLSFDYRQTERTEILIRHVTN